MKKRTRSPRVPSGHDDVTSGRVESPASSTTTDANDFGLSMHVITGLHGGGAERLLTNLLRQKSVRQEKPVVVSLLPGGVFRDGLERAGIEVLDLGMRSRVSAISGLFKLVSLIRRRKPRVVQAWMYHANLLSYLAVRMSGRRDTRLLWGIFCSDLDMSHYHWSLPVVRGLSRFLSSGVDGIVYNADEALEFHRSIGFKEPRSIVISNCVDSADFRHDPEARSEVRDELGVGEDDVVVVVAARVDPMKDWSTVHRAIRDLDGVVTVAVGKGTENLPAQPRFKRLGWRGDVARVYSAADVFLLPSAFGEGTSLALEEAMSCGLPCIVTNVGGNAALVRNAGIVVNPRDPEAIRSAIVELVRDPSLRSALGQAARARVTETSSSPEATARTLRFFLASMDGTR